MAAAVASYPSQGTSASSQYTPTPVGGSVTPFALTTVHQQQQHLAFLRADEAALQNKATHEVENFDRHVALLKHFFLHFVDEFIGGNEDGADSSQNTHGDFKYRNLLQAVRDEKRDDLPVYLDDVREYFATQYTGGDSLGGGEDDGGNVGKEEKGSLTVYEGLLTNTSRYIELLYQAADAVLTQEADLFTSNADAVGGEGGTGMNDLDEEELNLLTAGETDNAWATEIKKRLRKRDPWRKIR
ncbi:dna replication licensing factor mcm7 [Cystoisospora suis]|uniref:Dna replication licensing factor mcm7 n=1 Tax=Cystoisospora suis TaxID=483139 RepID=A0A2C6L3W3_9APIC|nr:dna replication licensing factor mcm7 [Cystoisospora suis]